MNEDTHFTVGRELVAIHALLEGAGIDPAGPFVYPCGDAVHERATSAIGRLDEALKEEGRHDEMEIHMARATLAAIAMFALVGYAGYTLHPDGCSAGGPDENPQTPTMVVARGYASLLMDMARDRWPARAEWYTPTPVLRDARKDGAA